MLTDSTNQTCLLDQSRVEPKTRDWSVEEAIQKRIAANGAYAHFFNQVDYRCSDGVFEVWGRVPTNRLKRLFWSLIGDLDSISEVRDHLDVISTTRPSSLQPK